MAASKNNRIVDAEQESRDIFSDELISLRFLARVGELMDQRDISKKELASRLKTSPSYITQLFQGDKLVNVRLLTKIKRALNVTIEITCQPILPKPAEQVFQQLELPQANQTKYNGLDWLEAAKSVTTLVLNESASYSDDIIEMGMDENSVFVFAGSKSTIKYGKH